MNCPLGGHGRRLLGSTVRRFEALPPFLLLDGGGYGSGARVRRRAVLEAVLTGISFFRGGAAVGDGP